MKKPRKFSKGARLVYLAVILFLLSWILVWGNNSFYHVWKQKRAIRELKIQSDRIKAENDSLNHATNRLKTDPEAAEEVAREEHGMIKPDEVIYRFKPARPDTTAKKK